MKLKNVIEYLLVLILILECNTVYMRLVNYNFGQDYIIILGIIIFAFYVILNLKKISKNELFFIETIQVCLFLYFIINFNRHQHIEWFIIKYFVFFPSILYYFLRNKENKKSIIQKFCNVVFVLALISIIFFIFGSILKWIPSNNVLIKWGGINSKKSYLFLHFDTQNQEILKYTFIRNTGIFTESPMYSFILVLSIIGELIVSTNKNKMKLIIQNLCIISTFSAVGICCAAIIYFLKYLFDEKKQKMKKTLKIMIVPILFITVIVISFFMLENKRDNNYKSYGARLDDYYISFCAWKEHIVIGNRF